MKRLLLISAVLMTLSANARLRLHHLVSDGMVLQQQTEARLWGWADKGQTVTVRTSWDQMTRTTQAGQDGLWMVSVSTPKASYTPHTITFTAGAERITVSDVLAGEVWVCAGQSNMEMPVRGFGGCPVQDVNYWQTEAVHHPGVRSAKIPAVMSMTPLDDADTRWRSCSPQTVLDFSATGYFFARLVNEVLDIPVGIIEANKGGSRVESWLTRDNLERYTDEETRDSMKIVKRWSWDYHRQLVWGNGTFNPILRYTVKGILFYQGCSNVGDPGNRYSERLKLLVEQWRSQFQCGQLPFYFVQICPYKSGDAQGTWNALLQEQQLRAADIIPHSGVVCTNDAVFPWEGTQIHPAQKQKVGERLAYYALAEQYGQDQLMYRSPRYRDMTIVADTVKVHLDNLYGGLSRWEGITGFELAGEDQVFHPATASHFWQAGEGYWDECLVVTSPQVKRPVAVRYCFRNWQLGNLGNQAGLPLFPFRSDNW